MFTFNLYLLVYALFFFIKFIIYVHIIYGVVRGALYGCVFFLHRPEIRPKNQDEMA